MERDLRHKVRLASRHLELGAADALSQFGASEEINVLRWRYLRRLAWATLSGAWTFVAAAAARKGTMEAMHLQGHPPVP